MLERKSELPSAAVLVFKPHMQMSHKTHKHSCEAAGLCLFTRYQALCIHTQHVEVNHEIYIPF